MYNRCCIAKCALFWPSKIKQNANKCCVIRQLELICCVTICTLHIVYCSMHINFKLIVINLHYVFIATGHHTADVHRSANGAASIAQVCWPAVTEVYWRFIRRYWKLICLVWWCSFIWNNENIKIACECNLLNLNYEWGQFLVKAAGLSFWMTQSVGVIVEVWNKTADFRKLG